MHLKLIT